MSGRKGLPPARQVSEDTGSDWLFDREDSEDGYEGSEYAAAGPSSSGQTLIGGAGPSTSQPKAPAKKKRKRNPDGVIYARKKPKPKPIRTVSVDIVQNVQQHPVWKACYKKCLATMNDSMISAGTIHKAERSLTKLQEKDAIWGVIENKDGSGPCAECLSKGAECLVQLGATVSGYEITSNCMGCYVTYKSCDAYTGYNSRKGAGKQSAAQPEPIPPDPKPVSKPKPSRAPPSRESPAKQPATKARRSKGADLPDLASPEPERPKTRPPTPRKSTSSAGIKPKAIPHPVRPQSEEPNVRPEEVASALDDLKEFAESMSGILKKRDQLDIKTRGMLKVVEEQIEVIRRFAESQCDR